MASGRNSMSKLSSTRTTSTADLTIPGQKKGTTPITMKRTVFSPTMLIRKKHVMERRNALISRASSPIQRIEPSSSQRSIQRRFASYESPSIIRNAKAAIDGKRGHFSPNRTDILFDGSGRPISEHLGNQYFRIRLHFVYSEMYQFARDETRRSVIVVSFLEDLQTANFQFFTRSSENGRYQFQQMIDEESFNMIKQELDRKRTPIARSA